VFLLSLLDLPFSISPVVTGLMLTLLYGRRGFFAPLLATTGIQVVFAFTGGWAGGRGRGATMGHHWGRGMRSTLLGGGGAAPGGICWAAALGPWLLAALAPAPLTCPLTCPP
jgi:hypothetical protein